MFASLCNKYSETQYKVEAAKFENADSTNLF